ncbi:MAG: UDP-N-acetylmuramate--L-alanine ligase [Pseudomonadota bacterium]
MYKGISRIHFVGIGGIGMSGIAELLLNLGYHVSGSDLRVSDITRRLGRLGAHVSVNHAAENVAGAEVVVTSSAVKTGNVEVAEARRLGVPVIPRAEMLAELMRLKYSIAVAGAHGKTTTTSMVAAILAAGGFDPTAVIGGKVKSLGSNARLGQGEFLVTEADESDGSFLMLTPTIACVTNIDAEHLDYYGGLEQISASFLSFVNRVPFYGVVVLNLDDPNVQKLIPDVKKRLITYGFTAQADLRAEDIRPEPMGDTYGSAYRLIWKDRPVAEVRLGVLGRHNVYNSLAAAAVGLELDIAPETIASALAAFEGVDRRLQVKGEAGGVLVIDDYGHHPTEVRATLAALALGYPQRQRVVLFQPHRYSRLKALYREFCTAFNDADRLVITDVYPAGEKPLDGVSGEWLLGGLKACGHKDAVYIEKSRLAAELPSLVREGDLLLTLGAGDVWQIGEEFLALLVGRRRLAMGEP